MTGAASGRNTGLTVTIGNSPDHANRTIIDTQHTFDYAAGDMIRIGLNRCAVLGGASR